MVEYKSIRHTSPSQMVIRNIRSYDDFEYIVNLLETRYSYSNEAAHMLFALGLVYLGGFDADQSLTTRSDWSTFFANHYLRDICKLDTPYERSKYSQILACGKIADVWSQLTNSIINVCNKSYSYATELFKLLVSELNLDSNRSMSWQINQSEELFRLFSVLDYEITNQHQYYYFGKKEIDVDNVLYHIKHYGHCILD